MKNKRPAPFGTNRLGLIVEASGLRCDTVSGTVTTASARTSKIPAVIQYTAWIGEITLVSMPHPSDPIMMPTRHPQPVMVDPQVPWRAMTAYSIARDDSALMASPHEIPWTRRAARTQDGFAATAKRRHPARANAKEARATGLRPSASERRPANSSTAMMPSR